MEKDDKILTHTENLLNKLLNKLEDKLNTDLSIIEYREMLLTIQQIEQYVKIRNTNMNDLFSAFLRAGSKDNNNSNTPFKILDDTIFKN